MASIEPTLDITDLEQELETLTVESQSQSVSTRGRKNRSQIHNHTRPPKENEPERDAKGCLIYYCRYCPTTSSTTSGLRYHLQAKHQVKSVSSGQTRVQQEQESIAALYSKLLSKNAAEQLDQEVLSRVIDRQLVERTLLDLIVIRKLPLRLVEWPEFRLFCSALNRLSSSFIPTSHSTISTKINNSLPEAKDLVRKVLQSAKTNIHLAVDIWTSPNRHLFLAICGSFLDANDHFWNLLLALPTTHGHSGEAQWDALKPVLEDYGICEKIGTVVGDNSSTNDTLCRAISHYLSCEKRIDWSATSQRIRCLGHILNLIVQAFLFQSENDEETISSYEKKENERGLDESEVKERETFIRNKMGVLGKLHNIVVHIRASSNRTQEFIKNANRMVPLDNCTRWNSWYTMLKVALDPDVKPALQQYIEKYRIEGSIEKKDFLSGEEWIHLRTAAMFLEVFEGATLDLQGNLPTLSQVLENIDILSEHIRDCLADKSYKLFHPRIQRSFNKLNDYSKKLELSPYYAAARILHPERRTTWLFDEDGNEKIPNAKEILWRVEKLWDKFRRNNQRFRSSQTNTLNPLLTELSQDLSAFQKLRQKHREKETRPRSLDEFETFQREPVSYSIRLTPLEWWSQDSQRARFPQLSFFAAEILSIPAMSDKPERVFSGGRRTVSWDRSSISVRTVEDIECLRDWKSSGILDVDL